MMERYTSKTSAQKLGITPHSAVAVVDPPRNYASVIGELPAGAALDETPGAACPITLWFIHDGAHFREALPAMCRQAGQTKLWVVWRKGSTVTQPFLRKSAAEVGLVDYKICAVDTAWSAMLFARKQSP